MAKYTINYACGHGSMEKQLFGKTSERDRYIAWASGNLVCRDCYITGQRKADATAPQTAIFSVSGIPEPTLTFAVAGQIEAHKEQLKALGFRWTDGIGGVMDYLSITKPASRFCLSCSPNSIEDATAWLADTYNALAALGYKTENAINPLDLAMLRDAFAKKQEQATKIAEAIAANPKPVRPAWYQAIWDASAKGSTYNGKIYSGGRIYIGNVEHKLTKDQVSELEAYNKAWTAYKAAQKTQ